MRPLEMHREVAGFWIGVGTQRLSSVRNREGQLVDIPAELKACWHEHFNRVLSIPSSFDPAVLNTRPVRESRSELEYILTFEDMTQAMRRVNFGTAGGASGIVPELIACGGAALHHCIHRLIQEVWSSRRVVSD